MHSELLCAVLCTTVVHNDMHTRDEQLLHFGMLVMFRFLFVYLFRFYRLCALSY